jgi:hypothetical protein
VNSITKQKGFTQEFEDEAVRLARTSGRTRRKLAENLGIGLSTLTRWIARNRDREINAPEKARFERGGCTLLSSSTCSRERSLAGLSAIVCTAIWLSPPCVRLSRRRPREGLIHHSDRGIQYCSIDYQSELRRHGIRISMSGKGNCYDNAMVETFFQDVEIRVCLADRLLHPQRSRACHCPLHRLVLQSRQAILSARLPQPNPVRKTGVRLSKCLSTFSRQVKSGQLPNPTARQLPGLSTTIWVEPSSPGDPRHRGALNGESYRLKQSKARRRCATQPADKADPAADPETARNHQHFLKTASAPAPKPGHLRRDGRGTSCSTPTPQTGLVLLGPADRFLLRR